MEEDDKFMEVNDYKIEPGPIVKAVPRLLSDVKALSLLTEADAPPKVVKRKKESTGVCLLLWFWRCLRKRVWEFY
jgi:hypothetical protein